MCVKLAPVEAVNAVNPRPLAEMSLADAVATMYAVADYMQANKIDPLPLTPVDRLEGSTKPTVNSGTEENSHDHAPFRS